MARIAVLRHRGAMIGVVRSMGIVGPAVEDVVHDAFETACRKAEEDRPDPSDETRFAGWLCTLAKYAALTARNDRTRSREVPSPTEELEGLPESDDACVGRCEDRVIATAILENASEDDRELFRRHFYDDATVQELAAERGIPWTTMRSRLDAAVCRARAITSGREKRRA